MYFVPQRLQYLNIKTPIFCQEKNLEKKFSTQKGDKNLPFTKSVQRDFHGAGSGMGDLWD
jgi:hypothetical protein